MMCNGHQLVYSDPDNKLSRFDCKNVSFEYWRGMIGDRIRFTLAVVGIWLPILLARHRLEKRESPKNNGVNGVAMQQ